MDFTNTIIMKFGGTSVEDAQAFERVAEIVQAQYVAQPVVVVSAMSGVTDALLASAGMAIRGETDAAMHSLAPHFERHLRIARGLGEEVGLLIERARHQIADLLKMLTLCELMRPRLQDKVVASGEYLSAILLTAMLRERGLPAHYVDARLCIITGEEAGCATPLSNETEQQTCATLNPIIESGSIPVLGGFVGATLKGITTTLGRGGSDYTASLVGAALRAREIQIWTDVNGVMTADPRVVNSARTVARLSYAEASELAYFGAKVLHPKTIQPAVKHDIPVRICNSRTPEEFGTLVCAEPQTAPRTVKAIAHKTGVTTVKVTSARFLGAYGFLRRIFEVFDRHRTVVDVVTTSEVSLSMTLEDARMLPAIVGELRQIGSVEVSPNRAVVCIVGEGLCGAPHITAAIFKSINDIPVTLISQGASSSNLTFVVDQKCVKGAVTRLHQTFFETAIDEFQKALPLELLAVAK